MKNSFLSADDRYDNSLGTYNSGSVHLTITDAIIGVGATKRLSAVRCGITKQLLVA
jgi:hypothetical protein